MCFFCPKSESGESLAERKFGQKFCLGSFAWLPRRTKESYNN
jgi:hypothetical protein